MNYRNHEIKDQRWMKRVENVSINLPCGNAGVILSAFDLQKLSTLLEEKRVALSKSEIRQLGSAFINLGIRIKTYESDDYNDADVEVEYVWEESETNDERERRIERERKKIDKEIECRERKENEKKAEDEKSKEIIDAMHILIKNGYVITKNKTKTS